MDLVDIFERNEIPPRYVSEVFMQNHHYCEDDMISELDNRVDGFLSREGIDQIVEAEYICSGF